MNIVLQCLFVVAFCVGTVGAAGYSTTVPEEDRTLVHALFFGGLAAMVIFGLLQQANKKSAREGTHQTDQLQFFKEAIISIASSVSQIQQSKETADPKQLRDDIDGLLSGEYFDLTSRNEELIALLGFTDYAKIWEGVANAERSLARAWSMLTDGFIDEAHQALELAESHIKEAVDKVS